MQFLKKNWYWAIVISILFMEFLVFVISGESHTYIGIHDNLDIHITDYRLLRSNHAFFSHNAEIPLLGGINRDFLLSEWYLYSLLYAVLPTYTAYLCGYFLKIILALVSGILLGHDILKSNYHKNAWIIVLGSFTYGLLPLYPAFSFSFSSIPLLIYLCRRLKYSGKKRYYLFLFLYPTISYFAFFGLFILAYFFIYILYCFIKKSPHTKKMILGLICLAMGYITIEYRLFFIAFLSGTSTIRDTMVSDSYTGVRILAEAGNVFINSVFHSEDVHKYFVLPLSVFYLIYKNLYYFRKRQCKKIYTDPINLIFLLIIINCCIYALYTWSFFRTSFETLVPPLKGWQFNRTIFFNPFLWYLIPVIICFRLTSKGFQKSAILIMLCMMIVPLGKQTLYNDFYNTVYVNTYQIVKQKKSETLSYGAFFSENLFEKIKKEINYKQEYSVAYGFHPAVLSYNGIATLDGCLSYYPQSYKESFRTVIAPALNQSSVAQIYYDNWGGRAYIFSGTIESVWTPERTEKVASDTLMIDPAAFKNLGGKYIFSRIKICNAQNLGLKLIGTYTDTDSPYKIWVWSN